jgi:hypothetical protein
VPGGTTSIGEKKKAPGRTRSVPCEYYLQTRPVVVSIYKTIFFRATQQKQLSVGKMIGHFKNDRDGPLFGMHNVP